VDDSVDAEAHEARRVVGNVVAHAIRHVLLELFHDVMNVVGDLQGVGPRLLEHDHLYSLFVVEHRAKTVVG